MLISAGIYLFFINWCEWGVVRKHLGLLYWDRGLGLAFIVQEMVIAPVPLEAIRTSWGSSLHACYVILLWEGKLLAGRTKGTTEVLVII
jgi:hypothetical protein